MAERATVDMDTAFNWLRAYARGSNRRLAEVAGAVVDRSLAVDALRRTGTDSLPPSPS